MDESKETNKIFPRTEKILKQIEDAAEKYYNSTDPAKIWESMSDEEKELVTVPAVFIAKALYQDHERCAVDISKHVLVMADMASDVVKIKVDYAD